MSTKILISLLVLVLSALSLKAQVAINTDNTTAASSAMLDVKSTTKGVLIPRMTTAERTAISSPANGLLVYDATTLSFWFYDSGNSGWTELITAAGASELNDLSDGIYTGHSVFLGTLAGVNDDGTNNYNTGVGNGALSDNITGYYNVAQGSFSLEKNTSGCNNIAIGCAAIGQNTTGNDNTAVGTFAGQGSFGNSVSGCVFLGNHAGQNNSSDNKLYIDNTNTSTPLIGGDFSTNQVDINGTIKITGGTPGAGKVLTSDANGLASWSVSSGATKLSDLSDANAGIYSIFLGYNAGAADDGANYNTAVGVNGLHNTTSGTKNTTIGYAAGNANITGTDNTYLGYAGGYYNKGSENTTVGVNAGRTTNGNDYNGCVLIGFNAGYNNTADDKLFIANSNTSTPLIGGDFSTNQVDINGTIKITGGTPGAGKVLTSDANGLASWTVSSGATKLSDLSDANAGNYSTFIGYNAGDADDGGNYNTAVGVNGLHNTTSGTKNTTIGYAAGNANITGTDNTYLGYAGGYYNKGSENTTVGVNAGRTTNGNDYNGCVLIGFNAGYNNTADDKLFIANSNTSTPLIGGDFSTKELYFNTTEVGIGTDSPNEELEVAGISGNSARMIVSDGMGSDRNALLFVSPDATYNYGRIEAFKYGTSNGGRTLKLNTTGNGNIISGGNFLPVGHKSKDIGANGNAWDNIYADDFVNQGAAAFANISVTQELLNHQPQEKKEGAFDEFTDKGAKELDPASLPESLTQENSLLIDEMTTYNYKANYEQQQQLEALKKENAQLKALILQMEQRLSAVESSTQDPQR